MDDVDGVRSRRCSRRDLLAVGFVTTLLGACSEAEAPTSRAGSTVTTSGATSAGPTPTTTTMPVDGDAVGVKRLTAADFTRLPSCRLLPESIPGPFPLDRLIDRSDITEGYPGHPLRLGLRVVDAACTAIHGAIVEVWHADASGDYSAFIDSGSGKDETAPTTFLRGSQSADDDGIVEFHTIYPGWYEGRAVHIHVRVHRDGRLVFTGQMYFDEDYTREVYAAAPYAEFGDPDTSNEADLLAGDPVVDGTLLITREAATLGGEGTLGLLNLAIPA